MNFPIKDLRHLNFFLGIEVTKQNDDIHLSQHWYIFDVLQRTNMALAITSPMATSPALCKFYGVLISDPTLYRNTVGGQ